MPGRPSTELALVDPKNGRLLDVNPTFVQRSGYSRTQLLGGRIEQYDAALAPEQRSELNQKLVREGRVQYRAQKPRADGSAYPVDVHVQLAVQDNRVCHFYTFRELGELGRYEQTLEVISTLAQSGGGDEGINAAVRSLVDWLSLDFVAVVAVRADHAGEVQPLAVYHRYSPSEETPDPLRQSNLKHVLDGDEVVQLADAWRLSSDNGFIRDRRFECLIGLPLCDERKVSLGALLVARREPMSRPSPAIEGLRAVAHRLALELEIRRTREQGRVRGLQDSLTGLPNRLLFNDRLESVIQEAHRTGEMFAVLFVDLDRFKNINDSLGHSVGDHVLVAVAKRLRMCVRASDSVARYAGDEFTMILRHIVQREESFWIDQLVAQSRSFGFPPAQPFTPTRWLEDGDTVTVGRETLRVLYTPGHTPGHVVFFQAPSKLALVGDVLFAGSIGRTDFPRGDYQTLIDSIRGKLWPLGDDVEFISGHGPMSTFGRERRSNPFVGDGA